MNCAIQSRFGRVFGHPDHAKNGQSVGKQNCVAVSGTLPNPSKDPNPGCWCPCLLPRWRAIVTLLLSSRYPPPWTLVGHITSGPPLLSSRLVKGSRIRHIAMPGVRWAVIIADAALVPQAALRVVQGGGKQQTMPISLMLSSFLPCTSQLILALSYSVVPQRSLVVEPNHQPKAIA